MKFPVLWLSFVSLWAWASAEKGDMPRMGLSVPFAYHPCTSLQKLKKQKQKKKLLRRRSLPRHVVVHPFNNTVFLTGNPANAVTLQGPHQGYYTSAGKSPWVVGARKSIQLFIDRGHSFERRKKTV